MTARELASLQAKEIRKNQELMRLYISEYRGVFGYEPNCAGCTFDTDFNKFRKAVLYGEIDVNYSQIKIQGMTSFKLKRQYLGEILWYRRKNDKNVYRSYGRSMSEDFAENYLTHGSEEDIAKRKDQFEKLPDSVSKSETKAESSRGKENEETKAQVEKSDSDEKIDDVPTPKKKKSGKRTKKK